MSIAGTVEFQEVKVIAESELALCCRITRRDHWIAPHHLLPGSSVAHFGDRGVIIVTRRFAEDGGLLRGFSPPRAASAALAGVADGVPHKKACR